MGLQNPLRIACFVSSHGYGHASRACALMEAIHSRLSEVEFLIFSETPEWFFAESLASVPFRILPARTDVGFVQIDSLREDLPATLNALDTFLPLDPSTLDRCAAELLTRECRLVLCDLGPLGIGAARIAGVPSILIENFTWDWIYQAYLSDAPELDRHIDLMEAIFADANWHLQTRPLCREDPPWRVDHVVPPMSRRPRERPESVRDRLGIAPDQAMILVTMGGLVWAHAELNRLAAFPDHHFVIPGGASRQEVPANVRLLSHRSGFYHPDLVCASQAVVGKIGYSTLAEVYQAGRPFACVTRERFPESVLLSRFVREEMNGIVIAPQEFEAGDWIDCLAELLSRPQRPPSEIDGAGQAAEFAIERIVRA